jgi:putative hydrolase
VEVKPGELLGKLARTNPRELVRSATNGELATLLWPEPHRRLLERLTAAMTLVEGYAEHVMDAVGDQLDPGYTELRRALDRDRERRGLLDSIVSKVLGLEMKLAQYRRGKAFCDEVVRAHGVRTLNRAWSAPEALPRPDELDSPADWVERVGAARERRLFSLFR